MPRPPQAAETWRRMPGDSSISLRPEHLGSFSSLKPVLLPLSGCRQETPALDGGFLPPSLEPGHIALTGPAPASLSLSPTCEVGLNLNSNSVCCQQPENPVFLNHLHFLASWRTSSAAPALVATSVPGNSVPTPAPTPTCLASTGCWVGTALALPGGERTAVPGQRRAGIHCCRFSQRTLEPLLSSHRGTT